MSPTTRSRIIKRDHSSLPKMDVPHAMKGANFAGLGASSDLRGDLSEIIEGIRNRTNCTMLVMPNVEHAKLVFDGPQSDHNLKLLLSNERLDPFGLGLNPPINGSHDTTLAYPAQSQTPMIICAIGWHLRPEPLCFTATGNAVSRPPVSTTTTKPPSPDFFTANDVTNGALPAGVTYTPAIYEHGWWANYAAWLMVAGFNLRWMMGQNTNIINDELRVTAWMPPNAQDGTGSSSEVDIDYYTYLLNKHYQGVAPGSPDFLKVDNIRIGSVGGVTAGTVNLGQFTPSRDLERVEATYGGIGLRELLKGNSEYRPLTTPRAMPAGVPWGLFAEANNTDLVQAMTAYLSITNSPIGGVGPGGGTVPATFNDDPTVYAGAFTTGGSTVTQERLLDGTGSFPQTYPSNRSVYKGGRLIIEVIVKGFEISEDLHTLMKVNSRARDMICSECGISWGGAGR